MSEAPIDRDNEYADIILHKNTLIKKQQAVITRLSEKLDKAREAIKNLINENVSNREYNSSKSIYNITAENKAINLLQELDK